ncbi:hypothetical protein [Sinomicrobium sp. M5D2P17]
MKSTFFGILPAIVFLAGCNDGDLEIERVDFSESSITGCDNFEDTGLLFKIAENEALLLQLESDFLRNRITADSIESDIPGSSQLYYRFFDDAVTNDYFCNTVPPSTPTVQQEVVATGGIIRALSTPKSDGTGFNHGIVIHGAVLVNDAGERVIENRFALGTYTTSIPNAAIGATYNDIVHCNDTLLYKAGTDNTDRGIALVLDLEEGLFLNEETEEDSPIVSTIGEEGSRVLFYIYDGEVPDNYFCLEEKPETPVQLARYEAIQGEITITTTETSDRTGFIHQINFQKMILLNADEERLVAQNAAFGTYTVTTEEEDTP